MCFEEVGDCDGDASSGDQQRQRRLRNLVVGEEREIAASIDAPGIIYHRPFLSLSFFFPSPRFEIFEEIGDEIRCTGRLYEAHIGGGISNESHPGDADLSY